MSRQKKLHIICSVEMCKRLVPITIQKHSLNFMEALHAIIILKMLYFHNIFQYQVHTEICTFHMVTTSTQNKNMYLIPPKTQNSTHHKYGHFYGIKFQRFSAMQYHGQTHHHCYFLLWSL